MSNILDSLHSISPDFAEARRERKKIRQRYRKNISSLQGGASGEVYTISSSNCSPEYLSNWAEKKHIRADQFIKQNGELMSMGHYRISAEDSSEAIRLMNGAVRLITVRNWLSLLVEVVFIILVLTSLIVAVYFAFSGLGTVTSELSSSSGNSTFQLLL